MLAGKSIVVIAAMARNRAIGLAGSMPWHLPRELRHFKETTMGKPIVMGRKTWESIGRILPGRQNIVVTRNREYAVAGGIVAASLEGAVALAAGAEVMVIGGGQLYAEAMPYADRMILTQVDCEPEADTWFPDWREEEWIEEELRSELPDEKNPLAYRVVVLTRNVEDRGQERPGSE
ncbi:MAG: dihydrofolate reductase [Xanthomonadales bacterium]|jgi:dihydrofolate reductase|nr:dihydrofolate reductase [Xanthomonadales bacterium]